MIPNSLELRRRHAADCPHRNRGQAYLKCGCPLWVYGYVGNAFTWQSLKTRDLSVADRKLERFLAAPTEPLACERTGMPVREALEHYLAHVKLRRRAESTLESYRRTLEDFADFFETRRHTALGSLTLPDFDCFLEARAAIVKPKTLRKEVQHVRGFCKFCVKREWMKRNYAQDIVAPGDDTMPTLPFEDEEIHQLLEACVHIDNPNPQYLEWSRRRMEGLLLTLMYTGLRISDAVALDRGRLAPDGTLRLRQKKTGGWITTKLHPDAVRALRAIPPHPMLHGAPSLYFFWSGKSKLKTAIGTLRRAMGILKRITGINVHPHRFRDTFAVALLEKGEDIRTVSLLLGHKSVVTTERHYAHFVKSTQERLHAAVARLDFSRKEATSGQVIPFPSS